MKKLPDYRPETLIKIQQAAADMGFDDNEQGREDFLFFIHGVGLGIATEDELRTLECIALAKDGRKK